MVEAVFLGALIPLLFLLLVLQGENRLLMAFFTWGFVAFSLALLVNTAILSLGFSRDHLAYCLFRHGVGRWVFDTGELSVSV